MIAALEMTSAKWLIGELRGHGLSVSREPGQEDFGWHLNFQSHSSSSTFVISFRPDNEQEGKTWIAIIERNCGSSILTRRTRTANRSTCSRGHSQNPIGLSGRSKSYAGIFGEISIKAAKNSARPLRKGTTRASCAASFGNVV